MARKQASGVEGAGADAPGVDGADETSEAYVVRRYRPSDVEGVLDLDRTVWDRDRDREWFRWKYERNPYLEEPAVFVAERDGEIVGSRPFMGFRLRAGRSEETRLALQPADTTVHPDHRRRGIFTRMTERAIETYRDGSPGLFFNFPNEQSRAGYEKLGWRTVRPQVTHHRVEHPGAFVDGSLTGRLLDRGAGPAIEGYARAREAVSTDGADGDVRIVRLPGAAVERLADLYRRRPPERLHARRSEPFLSWRLASPVWDRTTYVAARGGDDVAAVVARTRTIEDGAVVTQIADVLPLVGGADWRAAVDRLLARVLADHGETDLFSVASGTLPGDLLASHGFLPDDRLPLSRLTSREKTLATRPIDTDAGDPAWSLGGMRLDRPGNWFTSFLEWDTS